MAYVAQEMIPKFLFFLRNGVNKLSCQPNLIVFCEHEGAVAGLLTYLLFGSCKYLLKIQSYHPYHKSECK